MRAILARRSLSCVDTKSVEQDAETTDKAVSQMLTRYSVWSSAGGNIDSEVLVGREYAGGLERDGISVYQLRLTFSTCLIAYLKQKKLFAAEPFRHLSKLNISRNGGK